MTHARQSILATFAVFLALFALPCFAIDNPDAPDFLAEFEVRAQEFEINVQKQGGNIGDTYRAYSDYENFLDHELNQAYMALMKHLSSENKKNLVDSQKQWLQFRDTEFLLIDNTWTMQNFGSSYVISRGASRIKIVRDRVITLLHYLKNF
jgi:uncharacterized protein YecT (DUF1311 family)